MKGDYTKNRKKFINHLKRLLPRGPDATSIQHYNIDKNVQNFIGHTRLSIVDPYHGDQPFFGTSKNSCSITNGEIYNHKEVANLKFIIEFFKFFKLLLFFIFPTPLNST